MSSVWSCNEWDPLEEIIVGSPLGAGFPTADPSTRVADSIAPPWMSAERAHLSDISTKSPEPEAGIRPFLNWTITNV